MFQFNTETISRHRAPSHFQKENRKRTFIVWALCVCVCARYNTAFFIHMYTMSGLGWMEFFLFHKRHTINLIFSSLHRHAVLVVSLLFIQIQLTNDQSHVMHTIEWRLFVLIFSICFLFLFGSAQFGLILFFGNGYYYFIFHLKNYNFTKNFCIHCWQHDQSE